MSEVNNTDISDSLVTIDRVNTSKLNRFEVVDYREQSLKTGEGGRTVVVSGPAYKMPDDAKIDVHIQDEGRTLKVFISDKPQNEK